MEAVMTYFAWVPSRLDPSVPSDSEKCEQEFTEGARNWSDKEEASDMAEGVEGTARML